MKKRNKILNPPPLKAYPIKKFKKPPRAGKSGWKWVKKKVVVIRKYYRPGKRIYKDVVVAYRRRKPVFERVYLYMRKARTYRRKREFKAWVQIPEKYKPSLLKEDWRNIDEYLDKIERELSRKYRLEIIRPMSKYGKYNRDKDYRIADPYCDYIEMNNLFIWKARKLPVKWKFDIYFMYYYSRVARYEKGKTDYKIIFQSNSFKASHKQSIFDITRHEIPKAIEGVKADMKDSGSDVRFLKYAFFSATTRAINRAAKRRMAIDWEKETW